MRKLWGIGVLYKKNSLSFVLAGTYLSNILCSVCTEQKLPGDTKRMKEKKSFDTILAFFVRNMLFSSNQCRMHFEKIVCKIPKIFTWSFLLMHAFAFGNYYFLTVGDRCGLLYVRAGVAEPGGGAEGCKLGCANKDSSNPYLHSLVQVHPTIYIYRNKTCSFKRLLYC